jgi:hypothetical protein
MLKIWLKKNELDGDTKFYEIDEWKSRGEPYLNDAEFVIVTEGGLNFMLNYGDPHEFEDLVESFGYFYELGHSWNLGFYPNEIFTENKQQLSYSNKLKDFRWQKKRKYILKRAKNKCEDCGSAINLEIHHCYYIYPFEPWEYPYDSLKCLCRDCHVKRGLTEQILRGHLALLKTKELESLRRLITSGLSWYPRKIVFRFLESFDYNQKKMRKLFELLLSKKKPQ